MDKEESNQKDSEVNCQYFMSPIVALLSFVKNIMNLYIRSAMASTKKETWDEEPRVTETSSDLFKIFPIAAKYPS